MNTKFNSKDVICLMGPTASGKTHLALALAEYFPLEIISVDSALIYREMDIGTAKPSLEERDKVLHHLIDICDPSEVYSAGRFREEALQIVVDVQKRGKTPLLVGGTMLYFHALQRGLADLPMADSQLRERLNQEALEVGWEEMHARLKTIDPESAIQIHPNDPQRIQRALEIYYLTGKTRTQLAREQKEIKLPFQFVNLAIAPQDREILNRRIEIRFQQMLNTGFIEEVKQLMNRGDLNLDLPSMRAVGYRQVWEYLAANSSYEQMCELGIIATRQLAKRQMTWLRGWKELQWFDSEKQDLLELVLKYLK